MRVAVVQLTWTRLSVDDQKRVAVLRLEQYRSGTKWGDDVMLDRNAAETKINAPAGPLVECKLYAVGVNGKESTPATLGFRLSDADLDAELPPPSPAQFVWQVVDVGEEPDAAVAAAQRRAAKRRHR
jgi:hypothetical protein